MDENTSLNNLGDLWSGSTEQLPQLSQPDQLEALLKLQRKILRHIVLDKPLNDILKRLCRLIEQMIPDSVATIMLLDHSGNHLDLYTAPSIPKHAWPALCGLIPGKGAGSCGNAVFRGKPIYVSDTSGDPRWNDLRHVAEEFGIRACWSVPIVTQKDVILGSFAVSSFEPRQADKFTQRLLMTAAYLAGIAIERHRKDEALQTYNTQLQCITNAVPGVVFQCRQQENGEVQLVYINGMAESLWGIKPDALGGQLNQAWQWVLDEDKEELKNSLKAAIKQKSPWSHNFRIRLNNQQIHWLRSYAALAEQGDGSLNWTGVLLDTTDEMRSRERLRQSAIAFENTNEAVIITDTQGQITDVNRAFTQINGYERDEVIGQNAALLQSGWHDRKFYRDLWKSLTENGHWQGEIWNRHKNGEVFPQLISINAVRDHLGQVNEYVCVSTDLTTQRESENQLFYLAHHDPLTGLPNRLLFNARLEHAIHLADRQKKRVALLFLDLDRFKNINDTLGHAQGDEMLQEVAGRVKNILRDCDTVARLGGDEFTIILEEINDPQDAGWISEKILDALTLPFELNGTDFFISGSIGISLYPNDGNDTETLLKNADVAMYQAKKQGRCRYHFYTPELSSALTERVTLERFLRHAMSRDEFEVYYQPQVDTESGRLVGVEALLRWHSPQLGQISPATFIPIAEDIGLIHNLSDWVLRQACRQWQHWQEQGLPPVRMSVNLSGHQITQPDLLTRLQECLEDTGFNPAWLDLEINESFVMRHAEQSASVLEAVRDLGINLAIDDFGTGYSSLSYLKRLPISTLKIDQSLVRDIGQDPNDEAISRAVVALGHGLGMQVIAEGVESAEQQTFLYEQGCDLLQGFLFGRPMSADAIGKYMRESTGRADDQRSSDSASIDRNT